MRVAGLATAGVAAVACQPQTVEVTRVVTETVDQLSVWMYLGDDWVATKWRAHRPSI